MSYPTVTEVRELLEYVDGALVWRCDHASARAGTEAGRLGSTGQIHVCINGRTITRARIVWALHKGAWHDGKIRHADGDMSNDRIENLRVAADSRERELTVERLKQVLRYDPDTGLFTWLVNRPNRYSGQQSGTSDGGYTNIYIDGRKYKAHRLAWLYMTGRWPADMIDHIDCNRGNNRFSNLREAGHVGNQRNSPKRKNNTSGVKGVMKRKNRWVASIGSGTNRQYIGSFKTLEEAARARREAADRLHGEFARHD